MKKKGGTDIKTGGGNDGQGGRNRSEIWEIWEIRLAEGLDFGAEILGFRLRLEGLRFRYQAAKVVAINL
jgi:hypothetical protein